MFVTARRDGASWRLASAWGDETRLPGLPPDLAAPVRIGALGTRFDAKPRKSLGANKTEIMARLLASLGCPVLLVDTRRDGVGTQSSWSPREFATLIPSLLSTLPGHSAAYAFLHLPVVAPSIELLEADRKHRIGGWQAFCGRYRQGLSTNALAVAQALVESAARRGGLAVFMCAERYCAGFDDLPGQAQDANCCHRFPLAREVAQALRRDLPGAAVERVDLDADGFAAAVLAKRPYEPVVRPI